MPRIDFFSDRHPLAAALAAALAKSSNRSLEVLLTQLDPADAGSDASARSGESSKRRHGALVCPGVPWSRRFPPRTEALRRRLSMLASAGRPIVLLSSAAVYEPRPGHPGFVAERPAEKLRATHPVARAWIEAERVARTTLETVVRETVAGETVAGETVAGDTLARLVVLRPCPVLVPGGDDLFSRLFSPRAGLAVVLAGHDPSLQLLSVSDLAASVTGAFESLFESHGVGNADGGLDHGQSNGTDTLRRIFHIAPSSVVPLRAALRIADRRWIGVGRSLHKITRPAISALGRGLPLADLDYVRYLFNVSADLARDELGWSAAISSAQAVRALAPASTESPPPGRQSIDSRPMPPGGFDRFGLDPDYVDRWSRRVWRFAHDVWWRIEVQGIENVPPDGAAVLSGIHRGYMPMDAVMMLHLLRRDLGRTPRFLIHPALVKMPFLFDFLRKTGGVVACQPTADELLEHGSIVGILPEGVTGAFAEYRNAYRLSRFGRSDFARLALRHQAPIVPFVTIGPVESMPIYRLWKWSWWRKTMGWPGFPISPTFFLFPPGLPVKWHTWILPPIDVAALYGPSAAEDREAVQALSDEVRSRLQKALTLMLARRRSLWRGNLFDGPDAEAPVERSQGGDRP